MLKSAQQAQLAWHQQDVEQRFGFQGGRFTRVNSVFSCLLAVVLTLAIYGVMIFLVRDTMVGKMFLDRGFTPYVMTFLFSWSLVIILLKWLKLRFQKRALKAKIAPTDNNFVLSVATVDQVFGEMRRQVDDPRKFVLFNRVQVALSNLRNLGRVTDVDEMLRTQGELDESSMDTSYSLIRGFIWAIPVLGFIGTVMGLSEAVGGFGSVLAETADPQALAQSLRLVTAGLSTAFETTLLALLFALGLQLVVTFLQKNGEEFLDDCAEYCQRELVSKLRIMPFENEA
ncbi:MAG: MotA/TolQ/ExbB proton channel family protein [Planctomycetota bacterium]